MSKLLFSTDTDSGTITVFDADRDPMVQLGKIAVGNGPRGAVRFTKDGRGFVTNHAGNTLSEIDALSMRELSRITVGIAPIGLAIAPGDRFAVVSNAGDNTVSIVDLRARQEKATIPVGREPRHPDITPDGKVAFIPVSGSDYISMLDIAELAKDQPNFSAIHETKRIGVGQGTMPYSAAVSPNGRFVMAANNQQAFVTLIDAISGAIIANIDVGNKGARGTAYAPDSSVAFVSLEDSSEVVVVNLATQRVEQRFATGPGPRGLLFDSSSQSLIIAAFARTMAAGRQANSATVLRLGAAALTAGAPAPRVRDIPVGAGPCSVSIYEH
jgi:YVTN family beta-propeller protein